MHKAYYTHNSSTVVDAPLETVWAVVRDILQFVAIVLGNNAKDLTWHADGAADRIPSSFGFRLAGGDAQIYEEVTGRSEIDHWIEYRTRGQALSMLEFGAKLSLHPVTLPTGKTFIMYERKFCLVPGSDPSVELPALMGRMNHEMVALRDYFAARTQV